MITINNRDKLEWREGMTVQMMLDEMGYSYTLITVTVDDRLVPEEKYDSFAIRYPTAQRSASFTSPTAVDLAEIRRGPSRNHTHPNDHKRGFFSDILYEHGHDEIG